MGIQTHPAHPRSLAEGVAKGLATAWARRLDSAIAGGPVQRSKERKLAAAELTAVIALAAIESLQI